MLHGLLLCIAFAGGLLIARPARAEEASPPHWQFYFTPYLWISGVTGTTSTRNPNVPAQTATMSFGTLLSHLNSIPLIGAFEARYGRFGLLVDLEVVSLKSSVATQGPAFSGGTVRVTELISTELATYRVVASDKQTLDLGIGVRPIAYWTKFSFNPGTLPGFSSSPSISWAAPLFGGRYHFDLSTRFGLTAYGDVGGFGAGSNLTWQALGTVDYRYNRWLVLRAGYRYLHIDYNGNVLRTSTGLSGPIFGGTIRF